MNAIDVNRQGQGVDIQFDPVMIQDILDHGVDGFAPVIINFAPITNLLPLLGLEPREPSENGEGESQISRIDPYLNRDPMNREEELETHVMN